MPYRFALKHERSASMGSDGMVSYMFSAGLKLVAIPSSVFTVCSPLWDGVSNRTCRAHHNSNKLITTGSIVLLSSSTFLV